MDVLNAAGLTPLALLHRAASPAETRRSDPRRLAGPNLPKLAAVSSVLGAGGGLAEALTYDEALDQTVDGSYLGPGLDVSGITDEIVTFATENPLVVGGAVLALAVPIVLLQVLKLATNWGVESAKRAYTKLAGDAGSQLLDIRAASDLKEGSPDLRNLKKEAVAIPYRGDDESMFLKKLQRNFKDPVNTTLFILDKSDDVNSKLVAELATNNSFKAAYAIIDGAEGSRGWIKSGLPWLAPKKFLNVDFDDLTDAISSAFGESSDGIPVTLGLAAAAGLGIFAFAETETLLQLLGLAALVQLFTKKLLFAEDRKAALKQVDEFLNTKVAPKELIGEIKMMFGKATLPAPTNEKASIPTPTEASPDTSSSSAPVAVLEAKTETKEAASTPPAINSVPKSEVEDDCLPVQPRPLSPYPYYPDLKPPSSPSPSAP